MTKEELAKAYVEENSIDFMNALKAAFLKGFEAGVESTQAEKVIEDGVKFVDLGLPSGTLWSERANDTIIFEQANKLNIPTLKDWEEIKTYCTTKLVKYDNGFYDCEIISHNGVRLYFNTFDFLYTWYKNPNYKPCRRTPAIALSSLASNSSTFTSLVATGEYLPIFLVKRKDNTKQ